MGHQNPRMVVQVSFFFGILSAFFDNNLIQASLRAETIHERNCKLGRLLKQVRSQSCLNGAGSGQPPLADLKMWTNVGHSFVSMSSPLHI
jgi:hypothetical protein